MKRFFATLLVCVLLVSAIIPMTAFATGYTPSVSQKGDMNTSPKTGDTYLRVPVAAMGVSAVGLIALFAVANKKKEEG